MLAREFAYTFGIAQDFAIGNTHTGLVRLKIFWGGELHGVGCNDRQLDACGQLHGGGYMGLVVHTPCPLQLQVKPVRKNAGQLQRNLARSGLITLYQGLTYRPGLCTRQSNQALIELLQPRQLDDGLVFDDVFCVAAGQ